MVMDSALALRATSVVTGSFSIPDLPSYFKYSLRKNSYERQVLFETKGWFFQGDFFVKPRASDSYDRDNFAFLASTCYPEADYLRIRACSDFLILLFHLDDITDDMDTTDTDSVAEIVMNTLRDPYGYDSPTRVGVLIKDFWRRFIRTGSPGAQRRFIKAFDLYFKSIHNQSAYRTAGFVPSPHDYATLRRDTSGCMMCYALTEYANDLHIPDSVMLHPAIRGMEDASNDLVSFANDIYSYNLEQSKGDTHNMIAVLMHRDQIPLQAAVERVGDICRDAIDRYNKWRRKLPSWGPEIDSDVARYADGLADWMVGVMHWSFETERYFGRQAKIVKKEQVVRLYPRAK